jgi:hypothetical protein
MPLSPTEVDQSKLAGNTSEINGLTLRQVLVMGAAGSLAGKFQTAYELFRQRGVAIHAADIVAESDFKPKFTGFESYFNLTRQADRQKLSALGNTQKFDLVYHSTWPEAHVLDAVGWDHITDLNIVAKPFAAIEQYQTLRALMELPAYQSVVKKLLLHDHYVNKPGLEAVVKSLPQAHKRYGKFARMVLFITERRTVNDEEHRKNALTGGMIADLDSHAVMTIQRLVPSGLIWEDDQGHRIMRISRQLEPTACVRAQMRNAICDEEVDTACVVEYRITETLRMVREDGTPLGAPARNVFYALVVCAKGLRADVDIERDLKAIEISFQGQGRSTGIIDLESNTLNEVLQAIPGMVTPDAATRCHKGVNRPMFDVVQRWREFSTDTVLREQLFPAQEHVWENMKLLWQTMSIKPKGVLLPTYGPSDLIHHFVNTHIGPTNHFQYFGHEGSGWPVKEAPLHLIRGQVSASQIP